MTMFVEITDFEKYILSKSGYSFKFDKNKSEIYEKKMINILKKYYTGNVKVKENSLYSIYNPLLESKPAHLIFVREILNDKVLIHPESEIKQGISVYSKKLKMNLILDSNFIELPLIALKNAIFIETLKIPRFNTAVLICDIFKKVDDDNFSLISPFLHLKEIAENLTQHKEFLWEIPYFITRPIFTAKLKRTSKNLILSKLSELQNFKEIKFNDGSIILLSHEDEKVKYEIIKGKFKINGKESKQKGEIFALHDKSSKIIRIESVKSGENIDVKIRVGE
ncbi:MAG: hypothetical protein XD76_0575 [candidate division TA06 bacterium 32_111]|uniref:Uncharacterized protein n=1 Tax=candidate division WOR-3 bacterium TaxID=2052148 RepID=A0A348MLJ2_UNCW3|nr:MAG: hypothetical protein XD76_0575 [candidate division TA06 bacterium 32_111]HAF07918.1 hypothetical protein [candidate division WOR-3 bacterium]